MLIDLQVSIGSSVTGQHKPITLCSRSHLNLTMDTGNLVDISQSCIARKQDFLVRSILEYVLKEGLPCINIKAPSEIRDVGGNKRHKSFSGTLRLGTAGILNPGTEDVGEGEIFRCLGKPQQTGRPDAAEFAEAVLCLLAVQGQSGTRKP